MVEGAKGSCIVRNLSTHLAATEDVAQNLLLQGQANRKVAETPMNQRSSRSHAVFSIQLTAKKHGSDVITKYVCTIFLLKNCDERKNVTMPLSQTCDYLKGIILMLSKYKAICFTKQFRGFFHVHLCKRNLIDVVKCTFCSLANSLNRLRRHLLDNLDDKPPDETERAPMKNKISFSIVFLFSPTEPTSQVT